MEAFKWGNAYAKELSSQLSKECQLKRVGMDINNDFQPFYNQSGANVGLRMSVDSAPTPINEVKSLSINPSFTMVCK